MNTAISFNDVTITFGGNTVVSGVSFDVKADELTVLVGRSGSGKSTLLRAINRLNECFEGCTTTGRIMVRLQDTMIEVNSSRMSPEHLRSRVGMVFQTPNVLPISIERNLLLPQTLVCGASERWAREKMEMVLEDVGLFNEVKDRLNQPAKNLSGGQQQRLCLARTLALEPEILLLDEPTASVDYKSSELIEQLLLQLAKKLPVLVVSHSLKQTKTLADRALLIRGGKLAGTWSTSDNTSLDELLYNEF